MNSHRHIQWVRPAQQARSQKTLERLLDSAEALLTDKGFDDITVAEIAARAGFSVGAVYSRFRDKKSVLRSVQDRFIGEANLTIDVALDPARWRDASIEEIVGELIRFLVELVRERRGVLRELLTCARSDPSMAERKDRLVAHVGKHLLSLVLGDAERIGHPDPSMAIRFGLRIILATLEQAILFNETGTYGIPSSDERLADELTRAFLGYLDLDERTTTTVEANEPTRISADNHETRRE